MSAVEDRRQRAREAARVAHGESDERIFRTEAGNAVAEAIEVATRVKLTPEIIEAAEAGVWGGGGKGRARAVLEAAGFEVVE